LVLKRNIVCLSLLAAVQSLAPCWSTGPQEGKDQRVLHFPEKRSLGTIFVVPPDRPVMSKAYWHNGLAAIGEVRVPKKANLLLRVGYAAIQDPSALAAQSTVGFAGLDLSRVEANDMTVGAISDFTSLKALDLRDTSVTDKGIKSLTKLKNLEDLIIGGTAITDLGLSLILPISTLKYLCVDRTAVSFIKSKNIQQCPHLQRLSAKGCRISDESMIAFSHLPSLSQLDLCSNPKVTAGALMQLNAVPTLHTIYLEDTGVTARDLPVVLKLCARSPALTRISVSGRSFTAANLMQWRHALPRVTILSGQYQGDNNLDARQIIVPDGY